MVGRETARPVWMKASEKFKPDVKLGELQLVDYLDGSKLPILDATKSPQKRDRAKPPAAEPKPRR